MQKKNKVWYKKKRVCFGKSEATRVGKSLGHTGKSAKILSSTSLSNSLSHKSCIGYKWQEDGAIVQKTRQRVKFLAWYTSWLNCWWNF